MILALNFISMMPGECNLQFTLFGYRDPFFITKVLSNFHIKSRMNLFFTSDILVNCRANRL